MNYNAKMLEVFEKLGDKPTIKNLMLVKDDLEEVAKYVKQTQTFKSEITQLFYTKFIKNLNKVQKKEDRILIAWDHLVDRLVNIPTKAHLSGVVICCVPCLVFAMSSREDSKIILFN